MGRSAFQKAVSAAQFVLGASPVKTLARGVFGALVALSCLATKAHAQTPAPAPAEAAKTEPAKDPPKRPAGSQGGYTYSDGPKTGKKWRRAPAKNAASLRFLRFEMQPGDTGLLTVHASKVVDVKGQGGAGHWIFHFPNIGVTHRNDRNPLHAEGFPTALQMARLHPGKGGTDLIIDLRKGATLSGEWRKDAEGDFYAILLPTGDATSADSSLSNAPKPAKATTKKGPTKGAAKKKVPATTPPR